MHAYNKTYLLHQNAISDGSRNINEIFICEEQLYKR